MLQTKWVGAHPNNYMVGRGGKIIDGFIIHATQGTLQSAANWFNNPAAKVSANYGIDKKGNIEQYVSDADTSFHSGNWLINQTRLSIEFEDVKDGVEPTPEQYAAGAELIQVKARMYAFSINAQTIEPHYKYRATECPGDVNLSKLIKLANMIPIVEPTPAPEPQTRSVKMHIGGKFVQKWEVPEGADVVTRTKPDGSILIDVK